MTLTLIQMRERAKEFSEDFKDASAERAEAQEFWLDFFSIFGIRKRKTRISFEQAVTKLDGNTGFIDCFWPSRLIVEHKSLGENLDMAYEQLLDYTISLSSDQVPPYAIVSDFQNFRLINFDTEERIDFKLSELDQYITKFGFIYSFNNTRDPDEELKIKASKIMGDLHDSLKKNHYPEEDLEQFLTRLLFCLYAEDTGIFNKNQFEDYIFGTDDSQIDFTRTGMDIIYLFRTLDKAPEDREESLREELKDFPYVNGNLFSKRLDIPSFNQKMFYELKAACRFDWSEISPAIFGSLYQYVIDEEVRRQQGAHYTDESNVMKVINSLFLQDLWIEFKQAGANVSKLEALREKIGNLKFLDPACGCGNFLIISYRELRLLEFEILKKILYGGTAQRRINGSEISVIRVENFSGIEISDSAVNIAKIAMWFIEHQMNLKFDTINFHENNLPFRSEANIIKGNALRINWADVLEPDNNVYVLSNPPFAGKSYQTLRQKNDMEIVFGESSVGANDEFESFRSLDYVTAWYKKALDYIDGTEIEVAFVSTNSICQGEQVPILWKQLHERYTFYINFAHHTFRWSNEAEKNAGVYVIIIGFSMKERDKKYLFTYEKPNSKFEYLQVENINSYLIDFEDIFIENKSQPISDVPRIKIGSKPIDNGGLIFETSYEKDQLINEYPILNNYIRPYVGSKEFIHGNHRFCLWLEDNEDALMDIGDIPKIKERFDIVKNYRLNSPNSRTNSLSDYYMLFAERRQPTKNYILIPLVSSGNRTYIPIGFMDKNYIVSNLASYIVTEDLSLFGILSSKMHMIWADYVGGKLKSDFRYSNTLVYNAFPFPTLNDSNKNKIIEMAQNVLNIREGFSGRSLADLYGENMPPSLITAHKKLDDAVDKSYRREKFKDDNDRLKFLFDLYIKYTNE